MSGTNLPIREFPDLADPGLLWLGFSADPVSGWGVCGYHLAEALEARARRRAVPAYGWNRAATFLTGPGRRAQQVQAWRERRPMIPLRVPGSVVHALGKTLLGDSLEQLCGTSNLGYAFLEETDLPPDTRTVLGSLARVWVGSSWNRDLLASRGWPGAEVLIQGVDPARFPRRKQVPVGPFTIFSGGKLEYRKGQDLVLAAFRRFHRRHPEVRLVTAWHNFWPARQAQFDGAGQVRGLPSVRQGRLHLAPWLAANGVDPAAVTEVGPGLHHTVHAVYHRAHVAVFPNRCEGGTNLVAMETMACGVPVILSANTGHLDLVDDDRCFPLVHQGPCRPGGGYRGTEGWGESSVDELVDCLERVYADRQESERRAEQGHRFIRAFTWDRMAAQVEGALGG